MDQISLYLKKYENLGFKDIELKRRVREILKKEFDADLLDDDIKIEEKTIRLNVSGALKAEIFLKRSILEKKIGDINSII